MDATERRDRATAEAARWWAVLGNRPPAEVSEADRREFTIWLRESPLHIAENCCASRTLTIRYCARIRRSWDEIPGGTEEQADSNIVRLTPAAATAASHSAPASKASLYRRFAMAAGVVAGLIVAPPGSGCRRGTRSSRRIEAERREGDVEEG